MKKEITSTNTDINAHHKTKHKKIKPYKQKRKTEGERKTVFLQTILTTAKNNPWTGSRVVSKLKASLIPVFSLLGLHLNTN